MEKNTLINARIPAPLKAAALKAATADGRTLSGWLIKVIQEAIAASDRAAMQRQHFQGHEPPAPPAKRKGIK